MAMPTTNAGTGTGSGTVELATYVAVSPIPLPILFLALVAAVVLFVISFRTKKNDASHVTCTSSNGYGWRSQVKHVDVGSHNQTEEGGKTTVPVLFGTQTNTAEGFARKLAAEINTKFKSELHAIAIDLEDYEEVTRLSHEKLVLFCVATYGDGEPTSNAERFVEVSAFVYDNVSFSSGK